MKEIISICKGISCVLSGSEDIHDMILERAKELGIEIEIVESCCKGRCKESVNLSLLKTKKIYSKVSKNDIDKILKNI